jgi:hypothetical protein
LLGTAIYRELNSYPNAWQKALPDIAGGGRRIRIGGSRQSASDEGSAPFSRAEARDPSNSFNGTTEQAAEKPWLSGETGGKCPSGAKALLDSAGFMRGLKPPPPSGSGFSAACEVVPY